MRTTPLRRKKPLRAKKWPKRPRKRLRSVNAKRRARRKAKYNAFMRSKKWKVIRAEAIQRAGRRCEAVQTFSATLLTAGGTVETQEIQVRCPATTKLQVHHKTYARFGGNELPEDLQVLCKTCHERLHGIQGKKL